MLKIKNLRVRTEKENQQHPNQKDHSRDKKSFFPPISFTNRNHRDMHSISHQLSEIQKKGGFKRRGKSINLHYLDKNHRNTKTAKQSFKKSEKNHDALKVTGNDQNYYKSKIKTNLQNINKRKSLIRSFAWNTYIGDKQYNQDRVFLNLDFEFSGKSYPFFAIFDGHGGSSTSEFLYNNLFKIFQKYIKNGLTVKQSLQKSLQQAQYRLQTLYDLNKKDKSGSCALINVIDNDQIYIANLGDSRAIQITEKGLIKQLTYDHKPENQRDRVQKAGGKIYRAQLQNDKSIGPYRIWPSKLSVSRTIGDIALKKMEFGQSISSTPQIFCYPIKMNSKIIFMSDGAYQVLSNELIGTYFLKGRNIAQSIDQTILSSIAKGSTDNISILALDF